MLLHAERSPIPDVPAVYFIEPTENNVLQVVRDAAKGMYSSLWVNFTSRVSRHLLEKMAEGVAAAQTTPVKDVGVVANVYDMYADFVSLDHSLFSLNLPNVFASLNAPGVDNAQVETVLQSVADSLFCVLVTMGVVPIIRAQPGGPAEMVAALLDNAIRDHLTAGGSVFADIHVNVGSYAPGKGRPLLVIVDRHLDLPVMLHHTWTYQALTHDTLGLRLNRVAVPVKDTRAAVAAIGSPRMKTKTFDLDNTDEFWKHNARLPFPMVAEAVEGALQAYKQEVAELNRSAGAVGSDVIDPITADVNDHNTANNLAAAISSIPQLAKKKKMIDLHTNIATALLDQIKDRGLDGYFQVEEELLSRPGNFDVARVLALIMDTKGAISDKLRLFLIYYLCVDNATDSDLKQCTNALEHAGCTDLRAYTYLKSIRAFTKSMSTIPSGPIASSSSIGSGYAASVLDTLSQVAVNVNKMIISADKALATARVVQTLMDQKGDAEILDRYLLLDPRSPKGSAKSESAMRPSKEAIVFVVGPGNYIEYQNCQDHVCSVRKQDGKTTRLVANGKTVIYGATELCTGDEFVKQLGNNAGPDPSSQNGTGDTHSR